MKCYHRGCMKISSKQMAKLAAYSKSFVVALDSIAKWVSLRPFCPLPEERMVQQRVTKIFCFNSLCSWWLGTPPPCMHTNVKETVEYCIISPPGKTDCIQCRKNTLLTSAKSTREMSVTFLVAQHGHCELSINVPLNSVGAGSNQIFHCY